MIDISNLRGGVLIIGSLLWQDHLYPEKKDNIRHVWRDKHLNIGNKIMVKVPIRYGRLSRSNIYTMVFSDECNENKLGTGYIVPLNPNATNTLDDLKTEAEALSTAEGMRSKLLSKTSHDNRTWCILSILFNPQTVKNEVQDLILTAWTKWISDAGDYKSEEFSLDSESPSILQNGLLNIQWPKPVHPKRSIDLDFILATTTLPTKYPNVHQLAENVRNDNSRYYFINNFINGITTFQDLQVLNHL